MRLQAEEAVDHGVIALFGKQGEREKFALGFAHFARGGIEVEDMKPIVAPLMPQIGFALRDFVGMVGECVIDAAAVDIEIFAEVLHADAGALDMPAGVADAPRAVPFQFLCVELGLGEPEDKVRFIALIAVFLHALADADGEILLLKVMEDVVLLELGGIEIDVSARLVGVALFNQRFDDLDEVRDAPGCGLDDVGGADIQLFAVLEEAVGIVFRDLHDGFMLALCAFEHFILARIRVGGEVTDVCNIHHAFDVVPREPEVAIQHVLHDIGSEVSDVGEVVDRRSAGIHFHFPRLVRHELFSCS